MSIKGGKLNAQRTPVRPLCDGVYFRDGELDADKFYNKHGDELYWCVDCGDEVRAAHNYCTTCAIAASW